MVRCIAFCAALALAATASRAADEPSEELQKLAKALKSPDAKSRVKAAEDIGKLGKDAAPVTKELCDALLDNNKEVVGAALAALELVAPELYKPLNSLAQPKQAPAFYFEPIVALGKLGVKARPASGVITARAKLYFAEKGAFFDYREGSLKALAQIEADDPATVAFCKTLATGTGKNTIHVDALAVVAKWAMKDAGRDKDIIPLLRTNLTKGDLLVESINFAADLGPRAKTLLPELKKQKNSTVEAVRKAATAAVEKIEGVK